MNKRQTKKAQKKVLTQIFSAVLETCLVSDDPLATLNEIKTQGGQNFAELGLNLPPDIFDDILTQLEPIVKELGARQ